MNERERPSEGGTHRRRAPAARMGRVGLLALVVSALVLALPLLVPLGGAAKYVFVPGFVGFCFGLGCILNGWIDAMKRGE